MEINQEITFSKFINRLLARGINVCVARGTDNEVCVSANLNEGRSLLVIEESGDIMISILNVDISYRRFCDFDQLSELEIKEIIFIFYSHKVY